MEGSTGPQIEELDQRKTDFSKRAANRKAALIRNLSRSEIRRSRDLTRYHEALCFVRAFSDDRRLLLAAEDELQRFADRIDLCRKRGGDDLPVSLYDTGIAGTPFHYPYGYPMVCWLVDRFGDTVDIDWDAYNERADDAISPVVIPFLSWGETTAIDDESMTLQEWFEAVRGKRKIGFLRWIVERLRGGRLPIEVQETLYDEMELTVRWELGRSFASRTLNRMECGRFYYHTKPLRGRARSLLREIVRPLPRCQPVPRRRARAWIDAVRSALSVRNRELYPVALASVSEVYEAHVGRGVTIALFGMLPDRRLPFESDYGAFIVKNGLPIGYGVGALLLDRMEIAVNIFPTFRQGESAFVFEQFNRLFHHQFDCRVFIVERYQLGHDNDEGLETGSFWFYYKLGFRPVDPVVAALAEEEADRLVGTPGSRTSRRILKRLARSNTILCVDDGPSSRSYEISITKIGLRVSRWIEERFQGDREQAEADCSRELIGTLGIRRFANLRASEQAAFRRLSPLIALLPGLTDWTADEKRSLARLLIDKGKPAEAAFARGMANHGRLHRAFAELSRG